MTTRSRHGFTLLEMMVVLAIIGILASLAVLGYQRAKPRANLATISTDLHALFRNARQNAMASGRNTIVIVLPNAANRIGGTGRVLVIEDPQGVFFRTNAIPNFATFDPEVHFRSGSETEILQSLDFPPGVMVGGGMPTMPAPYASVNTAAACSFCGALDRGAVEYDPSGRATFHSAVGAALDAWGAALSLRTVVDGADPLRGAVRTLVLTATTGSVKSFGSGG